MNHLDQFLEDMKRPGGTVPSPDNKLREIAYSNPGTQAAVFSPRTMPEQSEKSEKIFKEQQARAQQEQQGQQEQQDQKAPQESQKPAGKNEESAKSALEQKLEQAASKLIEAEQSQTPPPAPASSGKKTPMQLMAEAIEAAQQEAQEREDRQQQQAQQQQQAYEQKLKQQSEQPQQDPKALDDLTKRVEVLEEHDLKHANNHLKTRDAIDTGHKFTVSIDNRVIAIEANYVGQQTYQDGINALQGQLNQVLKPTVIQLNDRPKVELKETLHPVFPRLLQKLNRHEQAYLVGPAGSGKTSLAAQAAKALGLEFGHISCSAGMAEAHLLGRMIANGNYLPSRLVQLYENGGLFLFDEVDAADANTMLVLNSALANGYMSVPNRADNQVALRHKNFVCLVAANTLGTGSFEYHGRNYLDAAFLDRFALSRLQVDYNLDLERSLLGADVEMARVLHKMRSNLELSKTRRVVSTRAFRDAGISLLDGDTPQQVLDDLMLGWSVEEKTKAMKDVVTPKSSPLKAAGINQRAIAATKREQEAANLAKVAKDAASLEKRETRGKSVVLAASEVLV